MTFTKQSFLTKTILAFALLSGIAILWQTVPAMQKDNSLQQLAVFDAAGKPSTGLRKLLDAFELSAENPQSIVDQTQAKWLRTPGKERWESEDPHANRKEALMPIFKEAGLVDEVKPQEKEFDYILIMGALLPRAQLRMDYAIKLWNEGYRFKEIVLLGSERALDKEQEPASAFGQGATPTNEYEMFQWVYNHADMPKEMKKMKTSFVFTPNTVDATGKVKRANTADTIREWMKSNPKPGTCLIVSNQPHVGYQNEVAKTFLPESFKPVPTGSALSPNARTCEILDALGRWIYQSNEILKKNKK